MGPVRPVSGKMNWYETLVGTVIGAITGWFLADWLRKRHKAGRGEYFLFGGSR